MGSMEVDAMIEKECFATCTGAKCPEFFHCEDHWGQPEHDDNEPNTGEGGL